MYRPPILDKIEDYGFIVFDSCDYDLNIIAVRNLGNHPNEFDDKLHVVYLKNGFWMEHIFQVTTDPGKFYLEDEEYRNGEGVAVIYHPQQARGAYKIGKHRGTYDCLKQVFPVQFWRDRSFDDRADYTGEVQKKVIGVNIHRSSINSSTQVDKYSAGCIVFAHIDEYKMFMALANKQLEIGYNTFTLTIIAE